MGGGVPTCIPSSWLSLAPRIFTQHITPAIVMLLPPPPVSACSQCVIHLCLTGLYSRDVTILSNSRSESNVMLDSPCLYCITPSSHSCTHAYTHIPNRSVTNQHKVHSFALLAYNGVGRRCPALQYVSVCVCVVCVCVCVRVGILGRVAVHAVSCSVKL